MTARFRRRPSSRPRSRSDVPLEKGERVRVTAGPIKISVHDRPEHQNRFRTVYHGKEGVVSHQSDMDWYGEGGGKCHSQVVYVDFGKGDRRPVPSLWLERV